MDLATRSQSHQPATPPDWVARRLPLFPAGTTASADGLQIGGCDVAALAADYGTPLYVFDAATLDAAAAEYRDALATHYPGTSAITYAGKALLFGEMVRWVQAQGLWLDCTGVGELAIARAAGFPPARTLVHGVNKSFDDLRAAAAQAAVIVVDNLSELRRLLPL
ncbi:MAG: diaminopimelate decarboxylase, partial [Caldilineaceae bacterium]